MIASFHGGSDSAVVIVHDVELVNAEPTAYVDIVDRLDSVDSVVSLRVDRLIDSVYHSVIP